MVDRIHYERRIPNRIPRSIPYSAQRGAIATRRAADRLRIITPERSTGLDEAAVVFTALHGLSVSLSLEIAASPSRVQLLIGSQPGRLSEVERALRGAAPSWTVDIVPITQPEGAQLQFAATLSRPGAPDWMPLTDAKDLSGSDPLGLILEALHPADPDGGLLIRFLIRPVSQLRKEAARRELTNPKSMKSPFDLFGLIFDTLPRGPRFEARVQRPLEDRLARPGFEIQGTAILWGSDRAALLGRSRSLDAAFRPFSLPGAGELRLNNWSWRPPSSTSPVLWREREPSLYLSDRELALLWHPPSESVRVPGIERPRHPSPTLPPELEHAQGILLGDHRERGRDVRIHLPRPDLDAGHAIVIGRTGVGKSTLLHRLNRSFIQAPDRPAVCIIDPHGDLVSDVVLQSIPSMREEDVVFLDLGDTDFPVGLPLFWAPPEVPREDLIQRTFSVFKLIFAAVWSPTRMEDAIFSIVATLCTVPEATLLDVGRVLLDPAFRRRTVARVADASVREFWSDYESLSEGGKREVARPILYRTRSLYRSSAVRNILCQSRGCDFTDLINRGGVLLIKLSGAAIQAEADLLGELIIARLHLALLARLALSRDERRPFYLTVDESHRFSGASLPILLSEGRKLGTAIILSTQYVDAWGEQLGESVLGNAGALIAFRSGPTDSHRLRESIRPFTPEQLQDLDRYAAFVKLQIDGRTMPALDIRTRPIDAPRSDEVLARIRTQTRRHYARPRWEVEAALSHESGPQAAPRERIDVDEE